MGLRQFPAHTNIWWVWGIAFLLIVILVIRPEGIMGKREFSLNRLKAAIFK